MPINKWKSTILYVAHFGLLLFIDFYLDRSLRHCCHLATRRWVPLEALRWFRSGRSHSQIRIVVPMKWVWNGRGGSDAFINGVSSCSATNIRSNRSFPKQHFLLEYGFTMPHALLMCVDRPHFGCVRDWSHVPRGFCIIGSFWRWIY